MAEVKSLTIHSTKYTIKDETARNNYSTLNSTVTQQGTKIAGIKDDVQTNTQDIASLNSTVSGHTSSISSLQTDVSGFEDSVGTLTTTVEQHTSQMSSINTLLDKYGSYNTDDTAVLWAGTSNRQLSTKTGAVVTAHYSVVGRIVFFNIYASAEVLETGERAWINCPKIFINYPALDNSMPIILANQNMADLSDTEQPSYGIIEGQFIKIYKRNNLACNWSYNNSGTPRTIRLSGFYISSNKVETESVE